MSESTACSTKPIRIAAVILAILAIPIFYNGWADMARSWRTCGLVGAHLERSDAAFQAGDYGLALSEANRAAALDPRDPRVEPALALARMHLLGWESEGMLAGTDLDGALADAALVAQRFPERKASAIAFRGLVARQRQALDQARTLFEEALALEPANGLAHVGMAYEDARGPDKADSFIEHVEAALKVRPDTPHLLAMLAYAHRSTGNGQAAADALQRAVALRADAGWLADLALLQVGLQKLEAAETSAALATRMDTRNPNAWSALGQVRMAQKKAEEAVEALQNALSIQETPGTLFNLGVALNMAGRFVAATSALQKLVNSGNREAAVLMELATALEGAGNFADAIKLYESLATIQAAKDAPQMTADIINGVAKRAQERLQALRTGAQPAPKP